MHTVRRECSSQATVISSVRCGFRSRTRLPEAGRNRVISFEAGNMFPCLGSKRRDVGLVLIVRMVGIARAARSRMEDVGVIVSG